LADKITKEMYYSQMLVIIMQSDTVIAMTDKMTNNELSLPETIFVSVC